MSQGVYSRDYVDHMYTSNERLREGGREFERITEDCPTEAKVGMIVGGIIGGGIGTAIPPHGLFTLPGVIAGGFIGAKIGEMCSNDRN